MALKPVLYNIGINDAEELYMFTTILSGQINSIDKISDSIGVIDSNIDPNLIIFKIMYHILSNVQSYINILNKNKIIINNLIPELIQIQNKLLKIFDNINSIRLPNEYKLLNETLIIFHTIKKIYIQVKMNNIDGFPNDNSIDIDEYLDKTLISLMKLNESMKCIKVQKIPGKSLNPNEYMTFPLKSLSRQMDSGLSINILYNICLTWLLTYIKDLYEYLAEHDLLNFALNHVLLTTIAQQHRLYRHREKIEKYDKEMYYTLVDMYNRTIVITFEVINILSIIIGKSIENQDNSKLIEVLVSDNGGNKIILLNRYIESILNLIQ